MLKVYLRLRGGAMEVDVDLHEVNYQRDIVKGRFVETVEAVHAPMKLLNYFQDLS